MNTLEGKAWRALAGVKGMGSKTLWRLADYLASRKKSASWLLQNPIEFEIALRGSKANIVIPEFKDQKYVEVEKYAGRQVTVLHPLHADFPLRLRMLKDLISLPALLYLSGNVAILNRPGVAIVGKRQAGEAELAAAAALASELAGKGVNVNSGYAAGIDTAAHLAALRAGGTTGIILAEGIHHFQTKPELQDYLTIDNILVVSQFEPDAKWATYMAMTRNKLVGALSDAVVVIVSGPERDASGRMSGTFDAGMAALRMGLPVFAVAPSFFIDPPTGNCQLIARGCRAWDAAAGAAPILEAMKVQSVQKKPGQKNLF
ncbi:MAG TPA: DNA-processing protein DprA [Patescibacteria group bacterium]|nr:DNA-processing protein DprA [Patescibacteria group bacterium]